MSPESLRRTNSMRGAAGAAAVVMVCLALVGCQPEPSPSGSPNPTSSPFPSASASSPTPTAPPEAGEEVDLPTACEQLYSVAMLAALQERGPLNDPGVSMTSTQNVDALELLGSGVPTIRCSWGTPSDSGLATNVTIIDAAQSEALATALVGAGFACGPEFGGTVCRFDQSMVTQDDEIAQLREAHLLRGNAWVSTYTINFDVPGYWEDVVAMLWG